MATKRPLAPPKTTDVIESHTASWSEEKRARMAAYIETQRLDYEPLINDRDHAILSLGKGDMFASIRRGQDVRVRSTRAKVDAMIGQPYHATFAVDRGTLSRREGGPIKATALFDHLEDKDIDTTFMPTANNSELFDNRSNQTMTQEDIAKLKAAGATGDEIIRAVAAASKTFEGKTEYSQEKWLRKKHAKYSTDMQVLAPTPQNIIAALLEREPRKILSLRDDTLAQLLSSANVAAGSVTLVVDGASGLVTGAAALRQGGQGAIISLHVAPVPSLPLMNEMNLSPDVAAAVFTLPAYLLGQITPVNRGTVGAPFRADPTVPELPTLEADELAAIQTERQATHAALVAAAAATAAETGAKPERAVYTGPRGDSQQRLAQRRAATELRRGAHSLIVATYHSPLETTLPLLPYLRPSSPIVVYCPFVEPLARLQSHLLATRAAVDVQVTETWYRPLQVLPNRTHPHMSMNATGGYLLHATTVALD